MHITPQLGTFNAGFEIIAAIPSSPDEYVVTGERHTSADPAADHAEFVTWRTWLHDRYASFGNGNYFHSEHYDSPDEARQAALRNMVNRAGYDAYELVSG